MNGTVWLITSGEYSSYGVHSAFSTEELAKAAIATWNKREGREPESDDYYHLEPIEVDPPLVAPLDPEWRYGFTVHIPVDQTRRTTCDSESFWPTGTSNVAYIDRSDTRLGYLSSYRVFVTHQEANDDPERAKKIAFDRLAQWKAEQEGIA